MFFAPVMFRHKNSEFLTGTNIFRDFFDRGSGLCDNFYVF